MKRSKLYRTRLAAIDRQRVLPLSDAVKLLKELPPAKFDETVECAFRLGIDPRQSDQVVRGAMVLPHGTGKSVRVVVVAEGDAAQGATDAGADEVGSDELLERIKDGWLEFDVLIATPDAMKKVRALGRVLGPRGLMPNPKTGTVTADTAVAVKEAKAGRVEYRADRTGCVHVPVGKLSFTEEALEGNITAISDALLRARPTSTKGMYMLTVTLSSTMGPGIRIDSRDLSKA
ncbi:MAG: 50S ribosomal protein L1 [Lentisphaerae bacterium]|jgi:large subunit ribosomal protein L1|nr:50S ribosomal protein L1 [Lentisphaerota bacterium]MBT4823073.1 50S ribosomal protein L1 [Lentisphaerota bacterium]MBT5609425.1 50S ribosomal protein L1 [Lentisphaerota bacterium]MBT7061254.1 50S ribosomal protein L1 [Lentisphaerota bacterium]MBT7848713.1 50S ribosomal protein L1 [Lentisphaerota bacterium]